MSSQTFLSELTEKQDEITAMLKAYIPPVEGSQKIIMEAMKYSIMAPAKRLRPLIMLETYRMWGGDGDVIVPFLVALELIHTYSLVHDDLPAMDNDEYRRGQLTTHAKFGEAMGILAGDGLLNLAYETATMAFSTVDANDMPAVAEALSILSLKAGVYGMVGGQVIDVDAEKKNLDLDVEDILEIYSLKTAALLEASLMVGAVLAGASDDEVATLEKIGNNVGVAFQIRDDLLDMAGMESKGRPGGSDAKLDKKTYASMVGIDAAEAEVKRLSNEALVCLKSLGKKSTFLENLINYLTTREK